MFVYVQLLQGYQEPLLYKIPPHLTQHELEGTLVRVPFRAAHSTALVLKQIIALQEQPSFPLKDILDLEPFPADAHYFPFIKRLSNYYQINAAYFLKRIRHFVRDEKKMDEIPITADKPSPKKIVTLTQEQEAVCDALRPHIASGCYTPTVLHGVTGSGKTEVYKHLIEHALAQHKTVLLLLPEVTLALQFQKLLRDQLPNNIAVHGFHSAISPKEKKIIWSKVLRSEPIVIIGVHVPVLLPIANLGLIIVDEEHEVGYQEKKHPKINTKEAAILRAQTYNIPILLGSATPSISTLYNVKTKGWHFFALTQRFGGNPPALQVVTLADKKKRKNFWISTELEQLIHARLNNKEQVIIFLNRRGFSFFVQCKQCAFIFTCDSCSISLTLHEHQRLVCHYCGYEQQQPAQCPSCTSAHFINKGIGTQQLVTILEQLFPTARIARADLDTTAKKKAWQKTVHDFEEGHLDILVGTQTVTKGFHFPRVTLVGIIWADLNIHFPIYNATEIALQQLIQVAGRAGRSSPSSCVVVQTMQDHEILKFIDERSYTQFYEQELTARSLVGYPPCIRLAELEFKSADPSVVDHESEVAAQQIRNLLADTKAPVTILGPTKPAVHMIKGTHMRKIYLKSREMKYLIDLFSAINKTNYKSQIFFTPNPVQ